MTEEQYCDEIRKRWPDGGGRTIDEIEEASEEVLALSGEALETHPYSAQLHVMRGDLVQLAPEDCGIDLEEALVHYRQAAELNPASEKAWFSIGSYLDVIDDDFAGAEEAFRHALAVGGSADSFAGLARVLAEQGREDEALRLLSPQECPYADDPCVQETKEEIEGGEWSPCEEEGRAF